MTVYVRRNESEEWVDASTVDVFDGTWPDEMWFRLVPKGISSESRAKVLSDQGNPGLRHVADPADRARG